MAGVLVVLLLAAGAYVGVLTLRPEEGDSLDRAEDLQHPPRTIGHRVGELAPDFTLDSLDGRPVTLSSFEGRTIILDFWASWCLPCRLTFPSLYATWVSLTQHGVVLVGVSLDRSLGAARQYVTENGYSGMITLWESREAAAQVAQTYGVEGIPHTLVIDPNGIIRFSGHTADLTADRLLSLVESRSSD